MWSLLGVAAPAAGEQNHRGFDKHDISSHMRWPLSSSWASNTPFVGSYLLVWVRADGLHTLRHVPFGVPPLLLGQINILRGVLHVLADTVFVMLRRNRNVWLCI